MNECLRDASGDSNKETNQSAQSGQSGQSGDEEMKAVVFEDSVEKSAPSSATEIAETAVHHSRPSREASAGLYLDPIILFVLIILFYLCLSMFTLAGGKSLATAVSGEQYFHVRNKPYRTVQPIIVRVEQFNLDRSRVGCSTLS